MLMGFFLDSSFKSRFLTDSLTSSVTIFYSLDSEVEEILLPMSMRAFYMREPMLRYSTTSCSCFFELTAVKVGFGTISTTSPSLISSRDFKGLEDKKKSNLDYGESVLSLIEISPDLSSHITF